MKFVGAFGCLVAGCVVGAIACFGYILVTVPPPLIPEDYFRSFFLGLFFFSLIPWALFFLPLYVLVPPGWLWRSFVALPLGILGGLAVGMYYASDHSMPKAEPSEFATLGMSMLVGFTIFLFGTISKANGMRWLWEVPGREAERAQ